MKSEKNEGWETQVRFGQITHDSYLFFPREFGDLLLEPGDELILVARQQKGYGYHKVAYGEDSAFFDKVKETFLGTQVMDRLSDKTTEPWELLKKAIAEAKESRHN